VDHGDTGIEDAVASEAGGRIIAHNIRGIVVRTIRAQLADIGLTPADVGTVIYLMPISIMRVMPDSSRIRPGISSAPNIKQCLDPITSITAMHQSFIKVSKQAKVELLNGNLDVFGDGSVTIISTPGHCSLLVRLRNTGPILL